MLTWDKSVRKAQGGKVVGESYKARIPRWGEASIHPHIHHPGELFLDCCALGIEMHPLGRIDDPLDAIGPAEMILLRTLEQHGVWCLEAVVAIGGTEE